MKTFTAAHGANSAVTKPTLTKGTTSLPPGPPTASNENIDPNATPPLSPSKYTSPSTPKSTPLHRRFLQEVAMSPATPPRTPTRNKRDTPTRGRDSPANGRESPSKQKLEIGQNGFYFSCELPISKVTPKKGGTPNSTKKGDAIGTPNKRTPSPLKHSSPVKKSPVRVLFGTPTRKTGTPTSRANTPAKRAGESNQSPTKSVKVASRLAQGPSLTPVPTLRIPPECLKDVTEEEVANAIRNAPSTTRPATASLTKTSRPSSSCLQPSNIGQLMASLGSTKAHTTRDWAPVAEPVAGTNVSPAPTPLRRASEKLRLSASPTFLRITARDGRGSASSPVEHLHVTQSPMPHSTSPSAQPHNEEHLADNESPVTSGRLLPAEITPMPKSNRNHNTNVTNGAHTVSHPLEFSFEHRTALDVVRQEQVQEHPPALFPQPKIETREGGAETGIAQPSEKHVKWQKPSSKFPNSGIPRLQKRAGTDPAVFQAMREEMVKTEASLRRSTGQDYFFRGPPNNNELPAMSNTLFKMDQEAKTSGPVGAPSISRKLTRTNSDTSSTGTVRASMVMSAQKRAGTQSVPITPQPPSYITTPASTRGAKMSTAKQAGSNRRDAGMSSILENERVGPKSAVSTKSQKEVTSAVKTSQQPPRTPRSMGTPSRPRVRDTVVRETPVATSTKSKAEGASIPRGARKTAFDTPTPTKVAPAAKPPTSTRKPPPKTPLPTSKRIQTRPVTPKPYDPAQDPRPYETKFASAVDIAGRVAEWNSEDRKKAVHPAPTSTTPRAIISPTKKAAKPHKPKMDKESHTPQGSPTKLPSPVKNPAVNPLPNPPKTPGPCKTAVNKLKEANALKTPAGRRILVLDRNALRTPSKAIESSLDRAIDAKIEEDARSGKEFTPSGNRIRDLLDARGWKGVGL